jgi:hypothetical protein
MAKLSDNLWSLTLDVFRSSKGATGALPTVIAVITIPVYFFHRTKDNSSNPGISEARPFPGRVLTRACECDLEFDEDLILLLVAEPSCSAKRRSYLSALSMADCILMTDSVAVSNCSRVFSMKSSDGEFYCLYQPYLANAGTFAE